METTSIHPPSGISFGFRELWHHRELFYFFTWRDIKVKYKQTVLGIAWAVIQPLLMMLLFTFLFSKSLNTFWSVEIPYPVFVLSGLILWNLFNGAVSHAGESMIHNSNIIKKIYFPRLIIPVSAILVSFFDFLIALVIFFAACLYYQQPLHWSAILYMPAAIMLTLLAAFGLGTLLAALNVKFRDFRYALPFLLQVLFFGSQVIYPASIIDEKWKYIFGLNPINGAIELFRSPLMQTGPDMVLVAISTASALLLTFIGLLYFRKTESYFADIA
jgi:lipopolysaccharide transport system permease protein